MSPSRAKAAPVATRHRLDRAILAHIVLSAALSIGMSSGRAATWSSTDATTTEAITNAPPQRDKPVEAPPHRRRATGTKHQKGPGTTKPRDSESSTDAVTGTEHFATTTLPGPGRSANTVTIGAPQIMLHASGAAGTGPGAVPCVPVRFAMGSPPQGQSAQVDSWYCPEGQPGHPLTPR
ncbi:hypothetical protein [Robbsia sp. KACC 23696]|uniref:hypothetical protein n=1 Tax=Robbsia sp. KACC 23696 TaxID=3149231 RepID=UPI00325B0441